MITYCTQLSVTIHHNQMGMPKENGTPTLYTLKKTQVWLLQRSRLNSNHYNSHEQH